MIRHAALIALVVGGMAVPSAAAVRCVKAVATPGCTTSIQAAVDAASGGDVVSVGAGIYFENVVVPAGKNGLQIVGAGKLVTIIDPDAPNFSYGIHVKSDGVVIKNLGIRNGVSMGIYIEGHNTLVQGCRLVGQRMYGILVAGAFTDQKIIGNEVRGQRDGGIVFLNGSDRSLVQANVVSATKFGIYLNGSMGQARLNRVTLTEFGIVALGPDVVIDGNVGTYNVYNVHVLVGDNPTITRNRTVGGFYGVSASCTGCTGGTMSANVVTGAVYGVFAQTDGGAFAVKGNRVTTAPFPFVFQGSGIHGSLNVGQGGGPSRPCAWIMGGMEVTLTSNTMTCSGPSFYVDGDLHTLVSNTSVRASEGGFVLDGMAGANSGNHFISNRSLASWGPGFSVHNGAVGTSLTGNLATQARVGLCHTLDNNGTVSSGNSFGTTSVVCDVKP